tara:strand:- start:5133 stop:5378 length:246 start_codon:yes stop_codon:yes gene_type:complete
LKKEHIKICWPNNVSTKAVAGEDWFKNAKLANFEIPTGCLVGSCGACEIDVNGETIRPCVKMIESKETSTLKIELTTDPFW